MGNFGHVQGVTRIMNGHECNFRSKLEYRYAVYLDLLKDSGLLKNWLHEDPDMAIEFEHGRRGNVRGYLPDFAVQDLHGDWEVHETKGWFTPIDAKKIRAFVDGHDNKFILIFGGLRDTKSARAQYNRAKRLEPHIEATGGRIIWEADKTLFKPIKHLLDF